MWNNNIMKMKNIREYCAPRAEDCTLLDDALVCSSGNGDNENYDQDQFEW